MTTDATDASPRAGSSVDLSQRMDRLERNHGQLAKEVAALTGTITRVELNQQHAEELNKLRFGALDQSIGGLTTTVGNFIARIEGIITGEVQTAQSRQGAELVADYTKWRGLVDDRLDGHDQFVTQGRLLGRIAILLVTGNVIAIIAAILAVLKQ